MIETIKEIENYIKSIPFHKFTFEGVQYEWQNGIYYKKVRVLERGMSFGELALTTGGKRSATVKCIEDCEFAILNKERFIKSED